jgi:hypothetical protein
LTTSPVDAGDEYPQAIADDYPGWGVEHVDGQWTAWCPDVTTAATLRAAIEQAITGNDPSRTGEPDSRPEDAPPALMCLAIKGYRA